MTPLAPIRTAWISPALSSHATTPVPPGPAAATSTATRAPPTRTGSLKPNGAAAAGPHAQSAMRRPRQMARMGQTYLAARVFRTGGPALHSISTEHPSVAT